MQKIVAEDGEKSKKASKWQKGEFCIEANDEVLESHQKLAIY